VIVCPSCGEQNPENARFCVHCGTSLVVVAAHEEERKLVTIVFAELLGFRRSTGEFDPEDLKRVLEPFHARVARCVANHGGTVDKFMGPVALCVLGAPVAHEDDPERGVRVALRIREAVIELDEAEPRLSLSVRIGVTTGEAVVAMPGVGPQIGEAVTGDVVNTASRLQTAANPGEILVGEPTYLATGLVFEWEEHAPIHAKGKAEPLNAWLAVASRGRQGIDVRPGSTSPFIGRRDELTLVQGAFRRSLGESTVQLVTITGEAGVGKSRLITELATFAEEWPNLVRWRQGRSLPYGEGLSFWSLGEIVKADAGILESDPPEDADAKLAAALEPYVRDAPERDWMRSRLAPLAGIESAAMEAPREELFNAWRRWFEALAADSPFVVVFEDLQWADDAMLAFVEHLVDWTVGLPLLVVCAGRPELYERHPAWGGGRRNSTSIALPPLSMTETSMLIGALLEGAVLPPTSQAALIDRCGGNPLYAEEFVRYLRDRGRLATDGSGTLDVAGIAMPTSIHLLIGARIDTLPPTEKAILQDAAVVGKVFWTGAVEAVSGLPTEVVNRALHESVKREFIRRIRSSSFEGQDEYAFNHMLVQEVAYGQIPRAGRANRHIAVARWLRAAAGDRVFDVAEMLGHHYGAALEYIRATDPARNTAGLEAATGLALMMAGDRGKRIDPARAVDFYRRARAVLPADEPERRRALLEQAEAAEDAGWLLDAETAFDEAIVEYRASDDVLGLGEALARRSRPVQRHGAEARALLEEAVSLLETQPRGPELARAYTRMAGHLYVSGDNANAIVWAEKALTLADDVGVDDEAVLALQYRGAARGQIGDEGGLEDLREALRRGLELGLGTEVATTYNNLAYELWFWEGPAAALPMWDEMSAFCRVRGFATLGMWAEAGKLESLFDVGRWDELLKLSNEMQEWDRAHGATRVSVTAFTYHAWVHLRRGDFEAAARNVEEFLPAAREIAYAEFLAPALILQAEVSLARSDEAGARAALREFEDATQSAPEYRRLFLPVAVRILIAIGALDEAAGMVERAGEAPSRRLQLSLAASRAVLAEARGDHEDARSRYAELAERWSTYGFALEEARTRMGLGRVLLALGREDEARPELRRARELVDALGAAPIREEIDALLAGAPAATA
jgi:class 3 adenylate cyclase/tetratricopeptide (TPR) repeat protein